MKSNHVNTQQNLKGKKHIHLSCGCCDTQDFREDYREKQDEKMIRNFKANPSKEFLDMNEDQRRVYYDDLYDKICLRYKTVLKYLQDH